MGEFEFGDNRYPSLRQQPRSNQQSGTSRPTTADRPWQQPITTNSDNQQFRTTSDTPRRSLPWQHTGDQQESQTPSRTSSRKDQRVPENQYDHMQESTRTTLPYALPPGAARWAVDRYNFDNNSQRSPSRASNEPSQPYVESVDTGDCHASYSTPFNGIFPRNPTWRESITQSLARSFLTNTKWSKSLSSSRQSDSSHNSSLCFS
jgi:hypothetical protein